MADSEVYRKVSKRWRGGLHFVSSYVTIMLSRRLGVTGVENTWLPLQAKEPQWLWQAGWQAREERKRASIGHRLQALSEVKGLGVSSRPEEIMAWFDWKIHRLLRWRRELGERRVWPDIENKMRASGEEVQREREREKLMHTEDSMHLAAWFAAGCVVKLTFMHGDKVWPFLSLQGFT